MFVPPFDTTLSVTIPLVPPKAAGAFTQLEVAVPPQFGVDNVVVMVELSMNPSVPPTPKNRRSVVPSKNSVSGEHSSPRVLFTVNVRSPLAVITPLANGNMYILGFEGMRGLPLVPETKPQPIMWPDVDPLVQNSLSNMAAWTFPLVQSPFPLPDPKSTVFVLVAAELEVKFAGS